MSNAEKKANDLLNYNLTALKNKIEDCDIRKYQLAKALKISRQTLNDYLDGTHDIPLRVYLLIDCIVKEKTPQ